MFLQHGVYDESLSSFFRNVDSRYDDPTNITLGTGKGKVKSLKARVRLIFNYQLNLLLSYLSITLNN